MYLLHARAHVEEEADGSVHVLVRQRADKGQFGVVVGVELRIWGKLFHGEKGFRFHSIGCRDVNPKTLFS